MVKPERAFFYLRRVYKDCRDLLIFFVQTTEKKLWFEILSPLALQQLKSIYDNGIGVCCK